MRFERMRIAISVSESEKARGTASPYFLALLAAGAQESELEMVSVENANRVHARDFDGILFAGGEDVDPALYGETKHHDNVHEFRARDEFEFALLDQALTRRVPILGICRGVQMINVKFGGSLYQDMNEDAEPHLEHRQTDQGKTREEATHSVVVTDENSSLGGIVHGACRVNSLHHQAVKRVGRGLKVTARSEDGFVEAVESAEEYPFLMAVQWHPEEMVKDSTEQRQLFARFLEKCREGAARR
jgi:putative glutamine amidotransferase